jgi:CBS domain-containing protein
MVVAHDLATPVELRLRKSDRLHRAAELFARSDFERLPVVDVDGRRFLGILAKRDLLSVYAQEVLGRPAVLSTYARSDQAEPTAPLELPPDFAVKSYLCPPTWEGRTLAELRTTQRFGVRVLEIRRRGPEGAEWVAPEARTVLLAGDELALLGPDAGLERLIADPEAPPPGSPEPT